MPARLVTKQKHFRLRSLLVFNSPLPNAYVYLEVCQVGCTYAEHARLHERTAPGGHIYPERMSGELLCLYDCQIGRVPVCELRAGPMGWYWFYVI